MSYMCKICGAVPVQKQGDVCQACSDPYSSVYSPPSQGSAVNNARKVLIGDFASNTGGLIPNGDDAVVMQPVNSLTVQAANLPAVNNTTVPTRVKSTFMSGVDDYDVEGNVRNYKEEECKSFIMERWFRTLFTMVPFTTDDTVHTFQVYQGWNAANTSNAVCDEVIVYGKITRGKINIDNTVRVWGKRDKSNSIVVTKIYNVSSDTNLNIRYGVSPALAWMITIFIISLPFLLYIVFTY